MTHQIDARRLLCPMPVIKAQDAIRKMAVGEELLVLCTDPGVKNDIPAWARVNRHEVLSIEEKDNEIHILLRKGER